MPDAIHPPDELAALVLRHGDIAWTLATELPDGQWHVALSDLYRKLTGFTEDHQPRGPFGIVTGDMTTPAEVRDLLQLRERGTSGSLDLTVARHDGSAYRTRIMTAPILSAARRTWLTFHRDITDEHESSDEYARLLEAHRKARRRTAVLLQAFDEFTQAQTPRQLAQSIVGALSPQIAPWVGVFEIGDADRHAIKPIAMTPDASGVRAIEAVTALTDHPRATISEPTFIACPLTTWDATTWVITLQGSDSAPFSQEDAEMVTLISARVCTVIADLKEVSSERARAQTIESAIFAQPVSFPGVDIAAIAGPPLPEDFHSSWCDAFPLRQGGMGLVMSQTYGVDRAAIESVATTRAALRALMWKDPGAHKVIVDTARLAYARSEHPVASGGQVVSILPHGDKVMVEMASVAHLPLVMRIPALGWTTVQGTWAGGVGENSVPMASAFDVLPRGTVLILLSHSLFDANPTLVSDGLHQLLARWCTLPPDAPAQEYVNLARRHTENRLWRRQRCLLVARILADGSVTARP